MMPQAVLFDMDGVLVDVRGSYRRAIAETVAQFAGTAPTPDAIQAFKDRGGFNNDWTLTQELLREAGHDVPYEEVRDAFQARYLGRRHDGLITGEPPLLHDATLEELAARAKLAVVTGRPEADARWTLDRFGWTRFFPVVVGMDQQAGREKPDPYGLELALVELGVPPEAAVYIGDTGDDQRAAVAAGMTAIGVVPPGLDLDAHGRHLMDAGARVVLSTPDTLPALLAAGSWRARPDAA